MEKEKPRDPSVDQSEKGPSMPRAFIVGFSAVGLITAGIVGSDEKEVIAGVGLLGLQVGALLLIKRFEVKKRN